MAKPFLLDWKLLLFFIKIKVQTKNLLTFVLQILCLNYVTKPYAEKKTSLNYSSLFCAVTFIPSSLSLSPSLFYSHSQRLADEANTCGVGGRLRNLNFFCSPRSSAINKIFIVKLCLAGFKLPDWSPFSIKSKYFHKNDS